MVVEWLIVIYYILIEIRLGLLIIKIAFFTVNIDQIGGIESVIRNLSNYFINKLKLKGIDYTMIDEEEIDSISSNHKGFASISSESMLGKVFGYFFNE